MALFAPKKGVNPHTRYPDAYYGRVFFDKRMFDGIELVGKIEHLSKKKAARLLIIAESLFLSRCSIASWW
jgi:hypothetical protein